MFSQEPHDVETVPTDYEVVLLISCLTSFVQPHKCRRTPQQARDSKWYIAEEQAVTPIREIERQEREEVDRAVAAAAAVCISHFSTFHSKLLQCRCGPARAHAGTAADLCFAHMLKLVGVGTVRAVWLLPSERVIITGVACAALRRRMLPALERQ